RARGAPSSGPGAGWSSSTWGPWCGPCASACGGCPASPSPPTGRACVSCTIASAPTGRSSPTPPDTSSRRAALRRSTMGVMTMMPRTGEEWTVDDLDRLPDDGLQYELLDGLLLVTP